MAEEVEWVKRTWRLPREVDELLKAACRGRSINGWVTDAVVVRLSNWEHPLEKITAKRKAGGRTAATLFDPKKFNEFGYPLAGIVPRNPRAEVGQAMRSGPDAVRSMMRDRWLWAGLNPDDYSDAMLQETMKVYAASKAGSA